MKTIISLVVLAVIASGVQAQKVTNLTEGPPDIIPAGLRLVASKRAEFHIQYNAWQAVISDAQLYELTSEAYQLGGGTPVMTPLEILRRAADLGQLAPSEWVDQNSPALQRGQLQPAEVVYQITTGGNDPYASSYRVGAASQFKIGRTPINLGGVIHGTTARAWIAASGADIHGNKVVLVGRGSCAAAELEDGRVSTDAPVFSGFPFFNRGWNVGYQSLGSIETRCGYSAVNRAFEDLRRKFAAHFTPTMSREGFRQ